MHDHACEHGDPFWLGAWGLGLGAVFTRFAGCRALAKAQGGQPDPQRKLGGLQPCRYADLTSSPVALAVSAEDRISTP